ncbi:MAG TPA: prepilin-type N-terminal cleavage/methylation domain-containing protein [Methylobacter sp.]|jgi:general secretion pathway protein J
MSCESKAKGERRKAVGCVSRTIFSSVTPSLKYAMGFTLIEVLIAMTLLSMMVTLLFASLRICAQSWEQGESKITDVNEVAVVNNLFQRHLSSAIPLWNDFSSKGRVNVAPRQQEAGGGEAYARGRRRVGAETENQDRILSFQGKKQALQFVSVFPASAGRSGMQLFSIQSQQQDGEQVINVTLTPFFPVTKGEEWRKEEVVLLRHVSDFTLAYFGIDDTGESHWQDEWLEKESQPRLVKINISTENGVFWPEMIVEVKAESVGIEANTGNTTESAEDRK